MAQQTLEAPSVDLTAHIKRLYHNYRHTTDPDRRGLFFSPNCLQVCRPTPSYAATSRTEIVQYLKYAQQGNVPGVDKTQEEQPQGRDVYTIHPLRPPEFEFGTDELIAPAGLTTKDLEKKAEEEEWVGMRVDLWNEGEGGGLLVKVQYWWRLENVASSIREDKEDQGQDWTQCLHDIMYLGPKDGTQGEAGLEILE